jgi:hypothetical protein
VLTEDGGMLTCSGEKHLSGFGLRLDEVRKGRRTFCRPCLDWSERWPHLAGALAAAFANRCFELDWITRIRDSRAIQISAKGTSGFKEVFGITLATPPS